MILPISEDRRINFTKDEVQVQKRTSNEKTQAWSEWQSYKYCATSRGAADVLLNEGYADSDARTLHECLEAGRAISKSLADKFDVARLES